jgi:hypothetical protein
MEQAYEIACQVLEREERVSIVSKHKAIFTATRSVSHLTKSSSIIHPFSLHLNIITVEVLLLEDSFSSE